MGWDQVTAMNGGKFAIYVIVGTLCGIISGFGIGGGSILMIWLTAAVGMDQRAAQSINLLYFLPTAVASLVVHTKRRCVSWNATIPAVIFGCIFAAIFAWIATKLDVSLLRKLFGAFLLIVGTIELFKKTGKDHE